MTPRSGAATIATSCLLLGAVLAGAPAASATPALAAPVAVAAPADRSFDASVVVEIWYLQFLGRSAAEDPSSRYWVDQLAANPPAQVLARLLATPEHVDDSIDDLYTSYLGREADPGSAYWKDGVEAGRFPLERVQQNIIASQEFVDRETSGGGDRSDLVRAWYAVVLGRAGGRDEVGYWVGRLGDGLSPLQVVREIWFAPEAVTGRIGDHHQYFLGRPGDAKGIGYWCGPEVASDGAVQIAFATSPEHLADPRTITVAPRPLVLRR